MPMDTELEQRLASVREQEAVKKKYRRRVLLERMVLLPLLLIAILGYFNIGRVVVQGVSMEPTLKTGDSLFFLKSYQVFSPLQTGDIVVLQKKVGKLEGEDLIKRVVFIQNANGDAPWPTTLPVAKKEMATAIFFPEKGKWRQQKYPNAIFVVGDNYEHSLDSREIGPMYTYDILGKVLTDK
jgi:signal peptidase I